MARRPTVPLRGESIEPEACTMHMRRQILKAGEPADRLSVAARGKLVMLRSMPSGRTPSMDVARAQTAGCLLTVSARQFQQILENHPKAALAMLEIEGERLRRAREDLAAMTGTTSEEPRPEPLPARGADRDRAQVGAGPGPRSARREDR